MLPTDQMGSIISLHYVAPSDIASFIVDKEKAIIELSPDAEWLKIEFKRNSVIPAVNANHSDAGLKYDITLTAEALDHGDIIYYRYAIIKIGYPNGTFRILGTPQYPLLVTTSLAFSQMPDGFNGVTINATGSQRIYPPIFSESAEKTVL